MSNTSSKETVRIPDKKTTGLTAVSTPLTGKCSYPGCQHAEDEKTEDYTTVKNKDYKFHHDCYSQWSAENRGEGRFKQEDKLKNLEEQTKAAKK